MASGVCLIKQEFVLPAPVTSPSENTVPNKDVNNGSEENKESEEPPHKKVKRNKDKKKGQNKARPAPYKTDRSTELCHTLLDEGKECTFERCSFLHDVDKYLSVKLPDIGNQCHNYETFGSCSRGVTCRFLKGHSIEKPNPQGLKDWKTTFKNQLDLNVQHELRKRTYDFSLSEKIVRYVDSLKKKIKEEKSGQIDTSGAVTDEDVIKLLPREKKKIDWKGKLYLSPLTTVGNLPFRRICKEFGVDVTCGEMAMCINILKGAGQEWALVKRHESEDLFGVQLCANNPHLFAKASQVLEQTCEIDFIDLNLGCPIDLVFREGAGSGLLRRENVLETMVRSTSQLLSIPLTLKTRTGVYSGNNVAHTFMPKFRDWGASLVTVHGRSREQRYTKLADWDYINQCAESASPLPVFGNGDVLSADDYNHVLETYSNISGVMIGRGALVKPWIFTEIKENRLWDIRSSERFDIIKRYVHYGLEHFGSDTKGVENTRRFLLEWLSFLYRYVPVGILENPPQKINERPPYFKGRDDLETLMASPDCKDWIKISEMLLGSVPEGFNFLPKHKANSYI